MERVTLPGTVGVYIKSANQKSDSTDSVAENFKNLSMADCGVGSTHSEEECSHIRSDDQSELEPWHESSVETMIEDGTHSSDTMSCPDDEHPDDSLGCSDDEEGWINPDNFKEACAEMGGAVEEEPVGVAVGCMTTDFAMQVLCVYMIQHENEACKLILRYLRQGSFILHLNS